MVDVRTVAISIPERVCTTCPGTQDGILLGNHHLQFFPATSCVARSSALYLAAAACCFLSGR